MPAKSMSSARRVKTALCVASALTVPVSAAPLVSAHVAARQEAEQSYCCNDSWDCWGGTRCYINFACVLTGYYGVCS